LWQAWLPWALLALVLIAGIGVFVWRYLTPTPQVDVTGGPQNPPKSSVKPRTRVSTNPPAAVANTEQPTAIPSQVPTAVAPQPRDSSLATERQIVTAERRVVQPAPRMVIPPTVAPTPLPAPRKALPAERTREEGVVRAEPPALPRNRADSLPPDMGEPDRDKSLSRDREPELEAPAEETVDAGPADVPLLEQMSPEVQTAIPKLKISILAYANTASERMAYINGQKYVEGQLLEGKLKVEAITRSGVVLSYQGQRFLIRP
jgi:hypothetical protein